MKFTIDNNNQIISAEIVSESKNVYSLISNGIQMFRAKTEVFDTEKEIQKALKKGGRLHNS